MQKKILLKKTREYLQSSFPENLLPGRKLRQSKKKLFFHRTRNLKTQVIKAKKEVFNQYANSAKKLFAFQNNIVSNKSVTFYNPKTFLDKELSRGSILQKNLNKQPYFNISYPVALSVTTRAEQNKFVQLTMYPPFLFSTNQIQYELSRKKTRSSDFKNQLKERKKLALIYGQLSKKYIKKILKQASKLSGKKHDNFFFLLEARLDVVIFRACFFSSIKSARQWINHNKILVNNQFINTSSYTLKPGDIISIKPKDKILLCRKIMHFLKKSFFKQNKSTSKQFAISTFLFQKLKSSLKCSCNSQFLIDHFKKNSFYLNSLRDKFGETEQTFNITKASSEGRNFIKNKVLNLGNGNTKEKFSVKKSLNKKTGLNTTYPNFILDYKQFLFQVKQVLRFVLNKYSNKNRYLHNTNSFAFHLSQGEKNTLISNLIELELLEKKHLESLEGLRGFLIHLKLKKLFFKSEKKKKSFIILNQNVLKPLNLEISYKNLLIIYLYPPQKITFACSIHMELISRSLV